MAYSMTGFGKSVLESSDYNITVEMKSVNSRYLDISIKLPRVLNELEDKVRKQISARVFRGKIDVFIGFVALNDSSKTVNVDEGLAKQYIEAMKKIAALSGDDSVVSPAFVAKCPDVLLITSAELDIEVVWNELSKAVDLAVDKFLAMRKTEGASMVDDLTSRCNSIENHLAVIEERAPLVSVEYKERLNKRIEDLLDKGSAVDESRLAQEVAIFADKCAIDEEIVRLHSHISQLREIVIKDEPIGRSLDFLIQEFNREANTIGSKSNDTTITNTMLKIKGEIEKMREQVQNIE